MHCDLSDPGLIKIQGKDASKFLQGQLTCNVDALSSGKSCMGAHCNREGRVIALFYLFQFEDAYYLLLQKEMLPILLASLKKTIVFFKCEMSEVNTPRSIIGKAIKTSQTENLTADQWKKMMIDEGIPTIYPETSGKFLPHELNLDKLNAIDFNKGCYTGQEIIARMHYRGKLKTCLFTAEISQEFEPKRGVDIYSFRNNEWISSGMVVDVSPEVYNHRYHLLIVANISDQDLYLSKDMKAEIKIMGKHHVKEN